MVDITFESNKMKNRGEPESNNNKGEVKMRIDRQVSEIHKINGPVLAN